MWMAASVWFEEVRTNLSAFQTHVELRMALSVKIALDRLQNDL